MQSLGLYLFLVAVSDADGLSWYSDSALCGYLSGEGFQLAVARNELIDAGLIAYRKPLYQVLDLSATVVDFEQSRYRHNSEVVSVGQSLQNIFAGGVK